MNKRKVLLFPWILHAPDIEKLTTLRECVQHYKYTVAVQTQFSSPVHADDEQ